MATVTATPATPAAEPGNPPAASRTLPVVYTLTILVSAVLLFLVQPLFARLVLPLLGGSPAVWNTCMVFYQAALLAGYAYAHFSTAWLGPRKQAVLHLAVLLLPLAVLPIAIPQGWSPPGEANPIPGLLALLALSVGLPFVVVSASSPLLQKWLSDTGHPSARDPYFLYAASNLGSMLALFLYPAAVEPLLSRTAQSQCWAAAYVVLAVLMAACIALLWRAPAARPAAEAAEADTAGPPSLGRRLHWVALALVPSSLMLGVTTHITTDVAAVPLLWVLPLALYLLTFILAFSRGWPALHQAMPVLMPLTALALLARTFMGLRLPLLLDVTVSLGGFFIIALACHGELARLRPAPRYLTGYYLLLSLGGVLGGLCNALVAPLVFTTVLEYPLALVAACLLRPAPAQASDRRPFCLADLGWPLGIGAVAALVAWVWASLDMAAVVAQLGDRPTILLRLGTCLAPVGLCCLCLRRRLRFGLSCAALLAAGVLCYDPLGYIQLQERSFFGQLIVQYDAQREYLCLMHGTTLHGRQSLDPARRGEALSYYHRTGPAGQVFTEAPASAGPRRVALLGLGVGTLASYARPGEAWTCYEIDPHVVRIAQDPHYFTFLSDAADHGARLDIVLGDARLRLASAPEAAYDLLVVDVFSSDAVPVHLLTREAIQLYLSRLSERGLVLINISNRYLELEPVLARLAADAGLAGYARSDEDVQDHPGKNPSKWVVLARRPEHLGGLTRDGRWQPLAGAGRSALWTDDFSNVLGVLLWKR